MTSPGASAFTPYSTVRSLLGTLPEWMAVLDAERIKSYAIYEQMYWSVPDTFKLVLRGENALPIYIPTGRQIVDTLDRYIGANFGWRVDPESAKGAEAETTQAAFKALFDRERFLSWYSASKMYGIMRGDWGWHVFANADKPEGTRISIRAIDPASMFKIPHPEDVDRVMGIDLIDNFTDGDEEFVKVQRYSKGENPHDPTTEDGFIWSGTLIFTLDDYGDPKAGATRVIRPMAPLPAEITALPVYHIPHKESPGDPFGSSALRGLERVMGAVNQAISDEELALALEGLGVYSTDAGAPVDRTTGRPTTWKLGPGKVINRPPGTSFDRVTGISTVAPYINHMDWLVKALRETSGASDAAMGKVDVTVAESGISLVMQLSPILAVAQKEDTTIGDIHRQMFYGIKGFLLAYENINTGLALVEPVFGPKVPTNKPEELQNVLAIVEQFGLVDWGLRELTKLGYNFTPDDLAAAIADRQAKSVDPFAARAVTETGAP